MAVLNTFTNYRIDRLIRSLTYNTNVLLFSFVLKSYPPDVDINRRHDDIIAREIYQFSFCVIMAARRCGCTSIILLQLIVILVFYVQLYDNALCDYRHTWYPATKFRRLCHKHFNPCKRFKLLLLLSSISAVRCAISSF